jgi:hypothetical protein
VRLFSQVTIAKLWWSKARDAPGDLAHLVGVSPNGWWASY